VVISIKAALLKAYLPNSDTPRLDAEVLLYHVLGVTRSHLFAWPEKILTTRQYEQFCTLLARRAQGEPIAYLIGHKEFWSLDLQITENTLIPRPETELLVELALERLSPKSQIIDLGTGSGAIALAIAQECQQCSVLATDYSLAALIIAQHNAKKLGLHQVKFLISNWCAAFGNIKATIIVSNPPYIEISDPHLNQGDVLYEPRTALVAGKDGLTDIRQIIAQAKNYLIKNGWLLLEHGYNQTETVQALFKQYEYETVMTYQDLAGLPRVTLGRVK
jgi:release factor glutamine methyltransferase